MKDGYKRILFFEIILFLILILNNFIGNILNRYMLIIFLFLVIFIFIKFFGIEKERIRYVKDVMYDIIIVCLIAFLLYYIFGIVVGFYKNDNYLTFNGIIKFILPVGAIIILREYLRNLFLLKCEGNKLLIIFTCSLFVFIDIFRDMYYHKFDNGYDMFIFIALILLPSICNNIVCTYICNRVGYKPNILWLLTTDLYVYLLPIIPNPNDYLLSVIRVIFPLIIMYKVYLFYVKVEDKHVDREYRKRDIFPLIMSSLFVIAIVYFSSGYFHYYLLAIASGSMSPVINKGDVVLIEKLDNNYEELDVGNIIAYRYSGVIVVHRIINIIEDNEELYIYTKGDANNGEDSWVVREDMIVGKVNYNIPYVGLPTVWLNGM